MHLTSAAQVGEPKELVCLNCQLRKMRKVLTGGETLSDSVWKMFVVKCTGHHIS